MKRKRVQYERDDTYRQSQYFETSSPDSESDEDDNNEDGNEKQNDNPPAQKIRKIISEECDFIFPFYHYHSIPIDLRYKFLQSLSYTPTMERNKMNYVSSSAVYSTTILRNEIYVSPSKTSRKSKNLKQFYEEEVEMKLHWFQEYAINWMIGKYNDARPGVILSDEMGLGKTIDSVCFINEHFQKNKKNDGSNLKYLVVCPLNVMAQWVDEFTKWTNSNNLRAGKKKVNPNGSNLSIQVFYRDSCKYKNFKLKWNVLITNYLSITQMSRKKRKLWGKFHRTKFSIAIFDEGHKLKTRESKRRKKCELLNIDFKVVLTATPFQIGIEEVHSLLCFIYIERFSNLDEFRLRYQGELPKKNKKKKKKKKKISIKRRTGILERLKERTNTREKTKINPTSIVGRSTDLGITNFQNEILDEYILFRRKDEIFVNNEMKSKIEIVISRALIEHQKVFYRSFIEKNLKYLKKMTSSSEFVSKSSDKIIQNLRDICDHPYILGRDIEEVIMEHERKKLNITRKLTNEEKNKLLINCSCKMIVFDKLLNFLINKKDEKVLVYSNRIPLIRILEDYCDIKRFKYCKITGDMDVPSRNNEISKFKAKGSKRSVFLLSTRAANLGLNLTSANNVVMFNQNFNPFTDEQAKGRAHRIGQKKIVKVFILTTKHTVEKYLLERANARFDEGNKLFTRKKKRGRKKKENNVDIVKKSIVDLFQISEEKEEEHSEDIHEMDIEDIIKNAATNTQVISVRQEENENETKINDPNFWEKFFPNYVDAESLMNQLYKRNTQYSKNEAKIFLNKLAIVDEKIKNVNDPDHEFVLGIVEAIGFSSDFDMDDEDKNRFKIIKEIVEKRRMRKRKQPNKIIMYHSSSEEDDDNDNDDDDESSEFEVESDGGGEYRPSSQDYHDDDDDEQGVDDIFENNQDLMKVLKGKRVVPHAAFVDLMKSNKKKKNEIIRKRLLEAEEKEKLEKKMENNPPKKKELEEEEGEVKVIEKIEVIGISDGDSD